MRLRGSDGSSAVVSTLAEQSPREAGLKGVELSTGVAQSGDFQDSRPYSQDGPSWQRQQVEPLRRDVLTQARRADDVAVFGKLGEKLDMQQVNLPQVGARRVGADLALVLGGLAEMGVPRHPETFDHPNLGDDALCELMS